MTDRPSDRDAMFDAMMVSPQQGRAMPEMPERVECCHEYKCDLCHTQYVNESRLLAAEERANEYRREWESALERNNAAEARVREVEKERDSWRRVSERLERDGITLRADVARLTDALGLCGVNAGSVNGVPKWWHVAADGSEPIHDTVEEAANAVWTVREAITAERDALRIGATSLQMRQEAEIARLTAERQGEEYEVVSIYSDDDEYRRDVVDVTAKLSRGDKVRVTKVEEGR